VTLLLGIGLIIGSAILMSHSLVFLLYDALKRIPPKKGIIGSMYVMVSVFFVVCSLVYVGTLLP